MERLTSWCEEIEEAFLSCEKCKKNGMTECWSQENCTQTVVDRLAEIEDILGNEYNLDRLKQLIEADREGRIKILPKSTENTCGTCENFLRIEGTKRGHCKLKPLVNSQYGIRYNIPFEPSQSRKACKNYEPAMKAMKEREEK